MPNRCRIPSTPAPPCRAAFPVSQIVPAAKQAADVHAAVLHLRQADVGVLPEMELKIAEKRKPLGVDFQPEPGQGGTTPAVELIRHSKSRLHIPIFVLVRPRAGDFVYSDEDHQTTIKQIQRSKNAGELSVLSMPMPSQVWVRSANGRRPPASVERSANGVAGSPMTHAVPMDCPLRDDAVAPSLTADEALAAAPRRVDDLFEVPKIIELGGEK